jgi:signal transduction histidine kinase/CheY-like chemotaxis protein
MPALVQTDSQRRFELGERTSIGRAIENIIQLDDPMVSATHALVTRSNGEFRVRDLGSRRGTFVGVTRIEEAALRDGDELLIGPVRLKFDAGAHEPLPEPKDSHELRRLRAIVELGRAIGAEHDLDRLIERVVDTCFQLLPADRGMVLAFAPGSTQPLVTISRARSGEPVEDGLSTSVLSQLLANRAPYLRTEIDSDLALRRSDSLSAQGVRSLVAVPLLHQDEWLGVLYLDSRAVNHVFLERDLELLGAIADQAALAIKNVMLVREMQARQTADWQRLERVVASLPVGVIVLDDARTCVLANNWVTKRTTSIGLVQPGAVVESILGLPSERLVGVNVREQVSCGTPESIYILNATTSGDGREAVIVIDDITEERAQHAKSAHHDRLAMIGQLAGGVAHDFNNLLCVIVNYAGMLQEGQLPDEAKEDVRLISEAGESATELVRQLLAFSRRESVTPKVIDLVTSARSMEKMLRSALGARIELVLDAPSSPQHVLLAPSQLEQIIMNLVVNARDAMPTTGRVTISISDEGTRVGLTVADTGGGMTSAVAARIFEPYYTTKGIGKGTGLGLAIVHGIVEHAGGTVRVASQVGNGTTFRILLPRTDLTPAPNLVAPALRGRVLVVDDEPNVRRLTERLLRNAGYSVHVAASAAEARSIMKGERFDSVLTDLVMPGMSGRELARTIAGTYPHTRIVFMSGYNPGSPIPEAQFLAKPFDRKTLLRKIEVATSGTFAGASSRAPAAGGS